MADEPITQPTSTTETQRESTRGEERITQLSEKVRLEAEAREKAEARATAAEKKAAFAEGYADMVATNPAAKEFKADIEAKVMTGYTVEDATFAVLGKAGKLGASAPTMQNPAGGSASTVTPQSAEKPVSEMSQEERRAQLAKDLLWT